MPDIILRITGDTRDAETKIRGLERSADATTRAIGRSVGILDAYYGRVGKFANAASANLQTLERQATRTAAAIRSASIESRGGGRRQTALAAFGGEVGSGFKDFALGAVGGSVAGATQIVAQSAAAFTRESVSLYAEATRSTAFLEATAKRTGQSYAYLGQEVQALRREFNLTQRDAEQALAQATRLAGLAGRPGDGAAILRGTLRASIGAGLSPKDAPTILRQISSGEDEAFDRLVGQNPSSLYRAEAQRQGRRESSLSDQEKLQIRINTVIKEGNASLDAYNKYLDSAAGKVDQLNAAWEDFKSGPAGSLLYAIQIGAPIAIANAPGNLSRSYTLPSERKVEAPRAPSGGVLGFGEGISGGAQSAWELAQRGYAWVAGREQERRTRFAGYDSDAALGRVGAQEARLAFEHQQEQEGIARVARLGRVIEGLQARFAGSKNPIAAIIAQGRVEAEALNRELARLPAGFEKKADTARTALSRNQSLALAGGVAGALGNYANLAEQYAQYVPRTKAVGYRKGFYGQATDELVFSRSFGMTTNEQYNLARETGSLIGRELTAARPSNISAEDWAPYVSRLARETELGRLTRLDPTQLRGDQLKYVQDQVRQGMVDQLAAAIEGLVELRGIKGATADTAREIKMLRQRLAPQEGEEAVPQRDTVIVINEVPGTTARLGTTLSNSSASNVPPTAYPPPF